MFPSVDRDQASLDGLTKPSKKEKQQSTISYSMPPTANHTSIIGWSEYVFDSKPTTITDFNKIAQPPLTTRRTRKSVSWAPSIALAYSITHVNDMSEEEIKAVWYEPKDYKAFKKACKESAILAEKKNRWEGQFLVRTKRSGPTLTVQDPATTKKPARRPGLGNKQYSDSMLVRPRRRPPSPNSPKPLLTSKDLLGGRIATRNLHRWASSSMSCVNEAITSPRADGAAASKPMTREDRRTLTRHLSDSMLAMPRRLMSPRKEKVSSDVDEAAACGAESGRPEINKGSRYRFLQKQQSDSALVKPRRGFRLLPLQQTAIKEMEEDEISLLSFDSGEVLESPSSQCGIYAGHLSDSVIIVPEGDLMSPSKANEVVGGGDEDINEGSLRTMDLETDGVDCKQDEKARSLSILDIEIHFASRTESQQLQRSGNTATTEAETELSLSAACFFEGDLSMPLTNSNSSPEDETDIGIQTKFLARMNDSNDSLLLHHAEQAGTKAKNLRRKQWSSRETRNEDSESLLRPRAQGVRGKSLSE
jgi:hypothetical protein